MGRVRLWNSNVEQFFILHARLARDISFKLVIAGEAKQLSFVKKKKIIPQSG